MTRPKISACITAGNEEANIRRCLESVKWCDEIVVVDSYSTDRTAEISQEYTDRVYQHEWLGYVGQKNFIRGLARNPWILFIDADEEISEELRDEILREFERGPGRYVGYRFPRRVFYLGRWIYHGEWYPDYKLRLFLKEKGESRGQEPHDHVVVDGPVKTLKGHLNHYTYRDLADHLRTMNRFSSISAREKYQRGAKFRWIDLLGRPLWRFVKGYIIRRGFMDGFHGFTISSITSFGVLMKYAKLWELEHGSSGTSSSGLPGQARSR